MRRLAFSLLLSICFSHGSVIAMAGEANNSHYQIEAYLRRYRRKTTNLKETKIITSDSRETALAALKQYAKEHNYKGIRIISEGPSTKSD